MRIDNEFTVHAPIEAAWALLTDVQSIAPCMPGAQLTGIQPGEAGDVYEGKVKVKLGPVVAEYKGTAVFVEKDDEKYRGVIDAKGRDSRGAGNAAALITVQLRPEGEGTTVGIDTDLKISGKIAQFGASMIQEVSEKLLGQFVDCLEGKLAAPPTAPEPAAALEPDATAEPAAAAAAAAVELTEPVPASGPAAEITAAAPELVPVDAALPSAIAPATAPPAPRTSTPGSTSASARSFQASPEPEALDLLDLAGGAAAKRLVPAVIAGAVAVAAVIFYFARR